MDYLRFRVTGISPLLMNNPESMGSTGSGMGVKKIPTPEDEAAAKAYRLPTGQLFVPAPALRASLINGGKGRRIGKAGASKVLGSALFNTSAECPLVSPATGEPLTQWAIDVRRAVVQGQGVRRARARIDAWQTDVEFEYDPDFLTPAIVRDVFSIAGRIVGILDYRPLCPKGQGGPFGRYTIELIA